MSALVVIRLACHDGPFPWAVVEGGAVSHSAEAESLELLAAESVFKDSDVSIAAILPGESCAYRQVSAPPRQHSKFISAARLLLEDELASPIDDQHIAVARSDSAAGVYAVDRKLITAWIDRFAEVGLALDYLTADFSCLDGGEEQGVLFAEHDRLIANFGAYGFSAELDLAKIALADRLAALPEMKVGVYSGGGGFSDNSRYHQLGESDEKTLMGLAGQAIESRRAVNILQGVFKPKRKSVVDVARWRRPAIMAAALGVIALIGVFADGYRTGQIADHYRTEATRIHREAFPDARGVNIRTHARGVLGAGGDASFLSVADILGRALVQHENVAIDRIRFDRSRNSFVFSVRSNSDAEISNFQDTLSSMGATSAETGGYRRSGAYWVGEMTVTL